MRKNNTSVYWFTSPRTKDIFLDELSKQLTIHDHDEIKNSLSKNKLFRLLQVRKHLKTNITHIVFDSFTLNELILAIFAKQMHIGIITRVRGGMNNEYLDNLEGVYLRRIPANIFRNVIRNIILTLSDQILPVSTFCKSQILYELPYIPAKKITPLIKPTIITNKQTTNHIFNEKYGLENNNFTITTLTSFAYRRKFEAISYYSESIFQFLQKNNYWKWIIVGGGKYFLDFKKYFIDIAKKQNIEKKVILTGFIDDVSSALQSTDIFFYPTFRDTASQALKEAQLYSLPVIVNRSSCGPIEFIPPTTLCQKQIIEEPGELETILKELSESETLRKSIGKENKEFAAHNYDLKQSAKNFLAILHHEL